MANMLIDDMRANKLNLPGLGACTPPSEVRNAVINNPGAFRAGSVGPDFYPDLFLGQGVIHPDNSGKWLDLMFKRLLVSVPSERDKNLAFTLGFMSHYAGDMFGHAYVNHYAGGWFPLIKDIPTNPAKAKIVIKHILVEEYMDQRVPANASMQLDPPINFIRDVFTCSDAHLLMKQMNVGDDLTNPLSKYIILRNDVHNDLLKTAIGVLPGVTQYVQNWEEDVDSGIVTWLSEWAKTAEIFSGSGSDKFKQVIDNLEKWFMLKFISMIGFPDFVGQVISFLDDINILGPIKDFLKQLFREIVIAIAKEALGELYTTLDEAIKAIESAFKDPKVYLDNGLLFAERNVSQRLDADFGNYGKESSSDKQTFHAVRQCLTMSKLCLIGTDNLNAIVKNASGTLSFKSSNYTPAARMGYITVKTGTASTGFLGIEGAGTDNNVYLGIRYSNGKKYEVLCDKPNYNDFEKGDEDTYPFIMPENVDLSKVSAITARMSGNTASGDWYCDWIEIKNSSRERLFRLDSDFWLSTGQNKEFSNFSKYYSIPSAALRIDPKIMNFLWSLGKI
ncbi:MAG: zinc dependent phospholipase C family protein [Clostridiales bacterium]|nr:zinc dependent phospholipase C family protein [Clostridiales bacterium]